MNKKVHLFLFLFFILLVTQLFHVAIAEEKKALVKVILEKTGIRIEISKGYFVAPYIVQSQENFQSISNKAYKTPDYADILAKTNRMAVDAVLSPGTSILIPVTDFLLKFKPEKIQEQIQKIESFLKSAGTENLFEYTWTQIDVNFSIEGGKTTYTKFNPKNLELTAPNDKSLKLILSFIQQPLLQIFEGNTKIEEVEVRGVVKQKQESKVEKEKVTEAGVNVPQPPLGKKEDLNEAIRLHEEATFLTNSGSYREAELTYKRALQLFDKLFGSENSSLAPLLNNFSILYYLQERYKESEALLLRALTIEKKSLKPEHHDHLRTLDHLGHVYEGEGRYQEALSVYLQCVEIRKQSSGTNHRDFAMSLNSLGGAYYRLGSKEKAKSLFEQALSILEKTVGADHSDVATVSINLAFTLEDMGDLSHAIKLYERTLSIRKKMLGANHPSLVSPLFALAGIYNKQKRYDEAARLQEQGVSIQEVNLGKEHPELASSITVLGNIYLFLGRHDEAVALLKRALQIYEKTYGPNDSRLVQALNNLAKVYEWLGRKAEAEKMAARAKTIGRATKAPTAEPLQKTSPGLVVLESKGEKEVESAIRNRSETFHRLFNLGRYQEAIEPTKEALQLAEKSFGPDHPEVAIQLNNLGVLYLALGHYWEAQPFFDRALEIREKAFGKEDIRVAAVLTNLGGVFNGMRQWQQAELFYRRALGINKKALGAEDPLIASSLNNVAVALKIQGRYGEAEEMQREALAIAKKYYGPNHLEVAGYLEGIASIYYSQGLLDKAEPPYREALSIREKSLGRDHPVLCDVLRSFAEVLIAQKRYAEAEVLLMHALEIVQKQLAPNHPSDATILDRLALLRLSQGRPSEAIEFSRKATAIYRNRAIRAGEGGFSGSSSERVYVRPIFINHIEASMRLMENEPQRRWTHLGESLEVCQIAHATSAAQAVSRMAARFGVKNDKLTSLIRAHQDAINRQKALESQLISSLNQLIENRDAEREKNLRVQLKEIFIKIQELDKELARDFPEYAELANSKPIPMKDLQRLLSEDEAVIAFLVGEKESYLWVVRNNDGVLHRLDIGKEGMEKQVRRLRRGLDQKEIKSVEDLKSYDIEQAHQLYKKIFAPAVPSLTKIRHIMVIPDASLQSLPMGVLVSEAPSRPIQEFKDYHDIAWLAKKYAFTTLPSLGALRSLRHFAKKSTAKEPFAGFGDPLLEGETRDTKGLTPASIFSRGPVADVQKVKTLPRLPETAGELQMISRTLKGDPKHIFLREKATETQIRSMDLSRFRVLAFSTHGLMAGEFMGVAEPALVFTPPKMGTEADDGLLTSSEITNLKLNADWVILSACNTAAPDGTPGAEGLSGLAKAFFYAGTRTLLVSHWSVSSEATTQLITQMFQRVAREPNISGAEALRFSMMEMINSKEKPYCNHPFFWAPFVLVGEGK
jgi:tetratricopeptide (TPR) repeat protein